MEIRNFTPSNNNTSFGMAFRQPKQMNEFADYVTCAAKHSLAKRGLKQFIKEQAKNDHFDVEFVPGKTVTVANIQGVERCGGFKVIPMTDEARKIMPKETMVKAKVETASIIDKIIDKYTQKCEEASGLKVHLLGLKGFAEGVVAVGKMLIAKPKEFLPASMREAGELATKMNDKVETKLAKCAEIADAFKPETIKFKKSDVPTEV